MRHHHGETLGDIVAADRRAAAVFDRFGLDFCRGGRQTLQEACLEQAVDMRELLYALDDLPAVRAAVGYCDADWPLDALIDHIVSRHHAYVRSALPVISVHAAKIAAVHGRRSPQLPHLAQGVEELAAGLTPHMMKEEAVLFPYIRALVGAEHGGRWIPPCPFGTIRNPIRMMEAEHREAHEHLQFMRAITRGYTLPDFACATYRACFQELQEFEKDLHQHVHLENNVLFPRAIRLEDACAR